MGPVEPEPREEPTQWVQGDVTQISGGGSRTSEGTNSRVEPGLVWNQVMSCVEPMSRKLEAMFVRRLPGVNCAIQNYLIYYNVLFHYTQRLSLLFL